MANENKALNSAQEVVEAKLAATNTALREGNLKEYTACTNQLNDALRELNKCIALAEYDRIATEPAPIMAAVKQFYIKIKKSKERRDKSTGNITEVVLEDKDARIDLEALCDRAELDKQWVNDCSELLALLTLREINVFEIKPTELSSKSFYFIHSVNAKKRGETPDSNTQVVKLLQKIVDEMIFVDNGEGKNLYKCTNHDLVFIHDAVTKLDTKEKCSIAMLNDRQFRTVIMSVLAHCLGEMYTIKTSVKPKK